MSTNSALASRPGSCLQCTQNGREPKKKKDGKMLGSVIVAIGTEYWYIIKDIKIIMK